MENLRKHADIKLVTTERRTNYLVSEPNYHTTTFFIENLLAIEMKETEICMNKPVCLELSILELTWYHYVKLKYSEKAKLCYVDTDSFIVYTKTDIFIKILQKILKLDLMLQNMNHIEHCLKEKIKE